MSKENGFTSFRSMSFFHILPSNVAPDTFPSNNAASYSTPISNPYSLNGKWEVALMNMTYSGCINTFNNDVITIEKAFNLIEYVKKIEIPVRFTIPYDESLDKVLKVANEKCKGVFQFIAFEKNTIIIYKFENKDVCIIMSANLMKRLNFKNQVITSYDNYPKNNSKAPPFEKDSSKEDYFITIVPLNYKRARTIQLKAKNEEIDADTLVKRFNERLAGSATMQLIEKKFTIHKPKDDVMLLTSPSFHKMLVHCQAGIFRQLTLSRDWPYNFEKTFKSEWNVTLYPLIGIEVDPSRMQIPIVLPPRSFKQQSDAIPFINEMIKDSRITFSLSKSNIIEVFIADETIAIIFSDTLRDTFAFDNNRYAGNRLFRASDTFSLTRRIHYLYVYSNISDYVRIGNMEAPLLAVIPFSINSCKNILVEKSFKTPLYVPVIQERISHINIEIHDGAGELIPFASDAVTSIRLHFRQL